MPRDPSERAYADINSPADLFVERPSPTNMN